MEILIMLFLILLNGIFAMSEIAMVSSSKSRLETEAKLGDKSAKKALELSRNPGKFLSTVQIGITLIGILLGIYSGEKIEDDIENYFGQFEILRQYSETIALWVIVVTLTFFSLVLGELVPKRIGLTMPEKISKILSFPMYWISVIAAPFINLLTFTSDIIMKLLRIKPSSGGNLTEEEIKAIIQEGTDGGAIQKIEQSIVERVFSLGDRNVSSLMTNRADTIYLKDDYDAEVIRKKVEGEIHSVYPLVNDKLDVLGIVFLKDLFLHINEPEFNISDYSKKPQYIFEKLPAYEALELFKKSKIHQAIVLDEVEQFQGILTLNDLLENLVGDDSEFYENKFSFVQRADGSLIIDGQYPMIDFLEKLDLADLAVEYPFNTISGLILDQIRRIPSEGDILLWLNYEIEILDMDGARIDKVLLINKSDQAGII
jgi:putative hemolysin